MCFVFFPYFLVKKKGGGCLVGCKYMLILDLIEREVFLGGGCIAHGRTAFLASWEAYSFPSLCLLHVGKVKSLTVIWLQYSSRADLYA